MAVPELPQEAPIYYYRGDYFEFGGRIGTLDPTTKLKTYWDLTGYTGNMQVREQRSSASTLIFEPTWDATADLANGYFSFYETDENMLANGLVVETDEDAPFYYDMELIPPDGKLKTWLRGEFRIYEHITEVTP